MTSVVDGERIAHQMRPRPPSSAGRRAAEFRIGHEATLEIVDQGAVVFCIPVGIQEGRHSQWFRQTHSFRKIRNCRYWEMSLMAITLADVVANRRAKGGEAD